MSIEFRNRGGVVSGESGVGGHLPSSVGLGSSSDTAGRLQVLIRGDGGKVQLADIVSTMDYGPTVGRGYSSPVYPLLAGGTAALSDGNGHTLADVYATLAAAQVDYPAATALSQTVDWAAVQHAGDEVISSGKAKLLWPAPAASWRINSTLTWQPAAGASFHMDLEAHATNGGVGVLWTGPNGVSTSSKNAVIRTLGLRYSAWSGLWIGTTNATPSNLVGIDFDGDATRTFAGPLSLRDTDIRFSNSNDCIGVRQCHNPDGGMTGGGGFNFVRVYPSCPWNGTGGQSVGFAVEYNNNLTNIFYKCGIGGPGAIGVTNVPSPGAGGPAVGGRSCAFIECESSDGNNASSIDFQFKSTNGTTPQGWAIIGGRFENGATFLQLLGDGTGGPAEINVDVVKAEFEGYASAGPLISSAVPGHITLTNCTISKTTASGTPTAYGSNLISLSTLPANLYGSVTVRDSSLHATTPFWNVNGVAGAGTGGMSGGWTVDVDKATLFAGAAGVSQAGSFSTQRYALFTASGTFIVPMGVTKIRVKAIGGGGGGGGGGSAAAAQLQTGGAGGTGGIVIDNQTVPVTPGDSITVTIGGGGTSGGGGSAGGNLGTAGGGGGATTVNDVTAGTTLVRANGGFGGFGSAASSTANAAAVIYGAATSGASQTSASLLGPGSGALSNNTSANPFVSVVGGAGGGSATTTNGGGGGNAQTTTVLSAQTVGSGSGTSAGVNGVTATQPGCGGGGGGGGAAGTGAGGNGGVGAPGQVEIWW